MNTVEIAVHGRGGHGAAPHLTVDPVLLASRIVVALQGIVAREVKDAFRDEHEEACAWVGRSKAVPLDLHQLVPVPWEVLRLGAGVDLKLAERIKYGELIGFGPKRTCDTVCEPDFFES